jgi:chemotaxis protein MotB
MTDSNPGLSPSSDGGQPLWNNLSRVLFVLCLLLGALAAWLYWGYGEKLREESAQLDEKSRGIALENERLKEHVGFLTQRLEEEVAKVSREKEEEMARLKATHDDMVKAMQKEIEQGQIKVTQLADRLSLNIVDKILFPSGEADISAQGKEVLMRVGAVLKQTRDKTFRIEGHTDNVPIHKHLQARFPTNWELSTARATNVVRFLQDEAGLDPAGLEAVGMGEYWPIASNKTAAGRSQNRRIEIVLFPRVRSLAKEIAPAKPRNQAGSNAPSGKPSTKGKISQ